MELIISKNINQLRDLEKLLIKLENREFSKTIQILSNASIGQHVRHIIDFYLQLLGSLESGILNYDLRKRDIRLESEKIFAKRVLNEVCAALLVLTSDKKLSLEQNDSSFIMKTSVSRELQYVYEHTTHHMAIIKIGCKTISPQTEIEETFGLADATKAHRISK
jgi:uncharacterized damage-inducible protein DinB